MPLADRTCGRAALRCAGGCVAFCSRERRVDAGRAPDRTLAEAGKSRQFTRKIACGAQGEPDRGAAIFNRARRRCETARRCGAEVMPRLVTGGTGAGVQLVSGGGWRRRGTVKR